MKNIKNIFMVSALSLGLVVGVVGVAGAATSTNYQKEIADWFENDHNPVVMHTNTVVTPVAKLVAMPGAMPGATPGAPPAQNNYHYNDGHSNMNPQQHKQMHITQPSESHMSGSESGHE